MKNKNALSSFISSKFAFKDHSLTSIIDYILKPQIKMLPEGSFVEDIDGVNEGIYGLYKTVDGFDYLGTGYNEDKANALINYNNKLVLQRQKIRLIAARLGIDYSDEYMKLLPTKKVKK